MRPTAETPLTVSFDLVCPRHVNADHDDSRGALWSIFFVSVSSFISLSPSLLHSISFYSRRSDAVKKRKKNFLPSIALSCSSRFLYSASFAPLSLSPRLLIVGFSNRSSLLCLSRMHTHDFKHTMCQGKQWSSQRHALTIQCNHFRQLGPQL